MIVNLQLIFVSNQDQFNKIKKFINSDIKKIISFEKIDTEQFINKRYFKKK